MSAASDGVRDVTPLAIGVVPFGLAIGTVVATADVPLAAGLASGPALLAGAAQLTVIQMLDDGVAPLVIVVSALMINARLLLYGSAIAPWFRDEPLRRRLLLAVPLIDQLFFICVERFSRRDLDPAGRRRYYVAAALMLGSAFVGAEVIGAALGARIPDGLGLEIAAPLALVGLLAKTAVDRGASTSAVAAGAVAAAAPGLPLRSTVLAAAVVGIAAGLVVDHRRAGRRLDGPQTSSVEAIAAEDRQEVVSWTPGS